VIEVQRTGATWTACRIHEPESEIPGCQHWLYPFVRLIEAEGTIYPEAERFWLA